MRKLNGFRKKAREHHYQVVNCLSRRQDVERDHAGFGHLLCIDVALRRRSACVKDSSLSRAGGTS